MEPFHIWSPSSDFLINIYYWLFIWNSGLVWDRICFFKNGNTSLEVWILWLHSRLLTQWYSSSQVSGTAWVAGCWSGQRAKPDILAEFSSEEQMHCCNTDSRASTLQWKSSSFCGFCGTGCNSCSDYSSKLKDEEGDLHCSCQFWSWMSGLNCERQYRMPLNEHEYQNEWSNHQINCGQEEVLCLMRLGPSSWRKKGVYMLCALCIVSDTNIQCQ